jgi:hypothetical protein
LESPSEKSIPAHLPPSSKQTTIVPTNKTLLDSPFILLGECHAHQLDGSKDRFHLLFREVARCPGWPSMTPWTHLLFSFLPLWLQVIEQFEQYGVLSDIMKTLVLIFVLFE